MTRVSATPTKKDVALIFCVALGLRLLVVAYARARFPPAADGQFYDVLAHRLAEGAGYTWKWPDGVVTYAAHYPVGYPMILSLAYRVNATPAAAMVVGALFGALGVAAGTDLLASAAASRKRTLAGGLALAAQPALLLYVPAIMTEGITVSLVLIAAALSVRARGLAERGSAHAVVAAIVLGLATLVRPQTIAAAPLFGAVSAAYGKRGIARAFRVVIRAGFVLCLALAVCAPWTWRNCVRMNRCALVSVNGGWNLLIGAETENGAWQEVAVPASCRTVWDEAGKDSCFEREARRSIASNPEAWVRKMPRKLGATFDYFGAAPWYLHASNPSAFGDRDKVMLGVIETVVSRVALLVALIRLGVAAVRRARSHEEGELRRFVALAAVPLASAGAACAALRSAWPAYLLLALVALLAVVASKRACSAGSLFVLSASQILLTAAFHAAFFGGGRYGLAVAPFVMLLAFAPHDRLGACAPAARV